jgi:hypothetical protein
MVDDISLPTDKYDMDALHDKAQACFQAASFWT